MVVKKAAQRKQDAKDKTVRKAKERMCCVCRERKPVSDLVRVARVKVSASVNEFRYFVDTKGNSNGRGCHICRSVNCIEKAVKTRALNRSFKGNIPSEVYDQLKSDC